MGGNTALSTAAAVGRNYHIYSRSDFKKEKKKGNPDANEMKNIYINVFTKMYFKEI